MLSQPERALSARDYHMAPWLRCSSEPTALPISRYATASGVHQAWASVCASQAPLMSSLFLMVPCRAPNEGQSWRHAITPIYGARSRSGCCGSAPQGHAFSAIVCCKAVCSDYQMMWNLVQRRYPLTCRLRQDRGEDHRLQSELNSLRCSCQDSMSCQALYGSLLDLQFSQACNSPEVQLPIGCITCDLPQG